MKQWDTFDYPFHHGVHPCVVISRTARCRNPAFSTVNILAGQSQRALRLPQEHEFLLDAEDGMDWETLIRLDFIWVADKGQLRKARKELTPERRRALGAKLIQWFGFWQP